MLAIILLVFYITWDLKINTTKSEFNKNNWKYWASNQPTGSVCFFTRVLHFLCLHVKRLHGLYVHISPDCRLHDHCGHYTNTKNTNTAAAARAKLVAPRLWKTEPGNGIDLSHNYRSPCLNEWWSCRTAGLTWQAPTLKTLMPEFQCNSNIMVNSPNLSHPHKESLNVLENTDYIIIIIINYACGC